MYYKKNKKGEFYIDKITTLLIKENIMFGLLELFVCLDNNRNYSSNDNNKEIAAYYIEDNRYDDGDGYNIDDDDYSNNYNI
jgi:hypothetical protein